MENKKTGPVTIPGKKVSSQNALKHGATSPRLINEVEQDRYDELLADLSRHYTSSNPLTGLQLARIARITIQLERIHDVIDAEFKRSRAQSNLQQNLMNSLKMDEGQRISVLTGNLLSSNETHETENQEKILLELATLKLTKPTSAQDFVKMAPLLCNELKEMAKYKGLPIRSLIDRILPDPNLAKKLVVITGVPNKTVEDPEHRFVEENITDIDLDSLMRAAKWKQNEILRSELNKRKLIDYETLLSTEEQATTPALDQLDKLMRYQTTLQRQVSMSIGELIALTKLDG